MYFIEQLFFCYEFSSCNLIDETRLPDDDQCLVPFSKGEDSFCIR